ncbi:MULTISPECIES: DUF3570 domain-containing protein [Microbulbifer]|uniref:DUF3570 domain-containing protein n=1 Tax=Microbulbifer TaxID=48073 RepID=UPI001E4DEE52|nr:MULTISPECIES: DUF3570 domain-containing protein [Microbulbifer]UHQ53759.1 DUF3570 domain-containing protein [Microbulbifer sp. YPW16]
MYHSYSGGGVTIDGPSILVRKNVGNSVSLSANYYVDMISGASIDVEATASPYSEQRDEYSLGADYLVDKTTVSIGYTNSSENDYQAETVAFGISQAFFGELSTLDMRVSFGNDDVFRNGDPDFAADAQHRRYAVNWNQILTTKLIAELSVETVADEGFLNNPYRTVRYADPASALGFSYQPEIYPTTRNSDAVALRAKYRLPYRAAIRAEYRRYADSWGVEADNIEFRYTHPLREQDEWILEGKLRFYQQDAADFYSDLFPYRDATNFRARDKELSNFSDISIGIGVAYVLPERWSLFDRKNTINFYWDHILFEYDDFRDVTVHNPENTIAPGEEPGYSFGANVIRLFWSVRL